MRYDVLVQTQQEARMRMSLFSDRLREIREKRGMTQTLLSERSGVSQSKISSYEGKTSPKPDVIAKLAVALQTTADFLTGLTDDPEPPLRLTPDERTLVLDRRAKGQALTRNDALRAGIANAAKKRQVKKAKLD